MRIAAGVEYDGTCYHGWQRQNNVISIQEKVEIALSEIASEKITVICAGRTDAGVHALDQVIHFDTESIRPDRAWLLGTNSKLPPDIRVTWINQCVASDFHARFSARARQYRYLIYNNQVASAILRNRAMWVPLSLDEKLMQEAAQYLLGLHDFSSFRGSGCQARSAVRNIMFLNVSRADNIITVDIKANAFLLHIVRCIVGMLVKVGLKDRSPSWAQEVLLAKDRRVSAPTAPPQGLYFTKVDYPALS